MESKRQMAARKQPNPIDVHVGGRLKQRRAMLGVTQEKLGEKLGLTFQQIQKYEKGMNRIGASRLQEIAEILEVPVSYFFEEADILTGASSVPGAAAPRTDSAYGFAEGGTALQTRDRASAGEASALSNAFSQISDARLRRRILDLVETLAEAQRISS